MLNVIIIGKGWLGSILFDFLNSKGVSTIATITPKSFLKQEHPNNKILAYELGASPDKEMNLRQMDCLIYTLPPSSNNNYADKTVQFFKKALDINPNLKIIYTSSSSVYGNQEGVVNEDTLPAPESINGKEILQIEKFLLETHKATIIRLAGLVGPKRHPIFYLSKKQDLISNPNQKVNLIHSDDIKEIVYKLITSKISFKIANLVCPKHPSRKEYYTFFAKKYGLKLAEFEEFNERKGKIVESKVLGHLDYTFVYSTPFEFKV